MSNDDLHNSESTAVTPIYEYWENTPASYSAQILAKVLHSEAPNELVFPLKLTPSSRNAIARTVMAACDQKIVDCERDIALLKRERDQSNIRRVVTFINTPLIAAGTPPVATGDEIRDEEIQKRLDDQEARWFLRYLTLRNILAFLVVFLGIVGSVIGFTIKEYRDKAGDLNGSLTTLQNEKTIAEGALKDAQTKLTTECVPNLATKTAQLDSANAQVESLNKNIQSLNANAALASKNVADAQAALESARKDNAVLQQKITDLQAPPPKK
jgi:hypothetical protein